VTDQRNQTVDIAKGLGIILVVFGHNWMVSQGDREIFRVVFSFHMPLFFFLSGIFLRQSSGFKEFLTSRMQSLLKPYFVTLLILGLVKLASDILHGRDFLFDFLIYMEGVLYGTGRTIAWPPLWYLPHLFVVSCAGLWLIKLRVSDPIKWLMLAASLSIGVLLLNPAELPWSTDLVPISLSFLVSGYLCRGRIKTMTFDFPRLLVALSAFVLLHYFFNDTIDLNSRMYDSLVISTLQALLGIYICLSLASLVVRFALAARVFAYIGSGTLFILLFHAYIQDKTWGLLMKPLGASWLVATASLFAGVGVPLALWEVSKRSHYFSALFLPRVPIPRIS
jgi:fucose 4-O-acetylase-like acetyltransferase